MELHKAELAASLIQLLRGFEDNYNDLKERYFEETIITCSDGYESEIHNSEIALYVKNKILDECLNEIEKIKRKIVEL